MSARHSTQGWGAGTHLAGTHGHAEPDHVRHVTVTEADLAEFNAGVKRARDEYHRGHRCETCGRGGFKNANAVAAHTRFHTADGTGATA